MCLLRFPKDTAYRLSIVVKIKAGKWQHVRHKRNCVPVFQHHTFPFDSSAVAEGFWWRESYPASAVQSKKFQDTSKKI